MPLPFENAHQPLATTQNATPEEYLQCLDQAIQQSRTAYLMFHVNL